MATHRHRAELAAVMDYLVTVEPRVHYEQVRPMATRAIATLVDLHAAINGGRGITMDCSEGVTLLCHLAGLRDPSSPEGKARALGVSGARDYDGIGYTGTLLDSLPHYYAASSAGIGALVVFGPFPGEHVCMVRDPGSDPLLWSHGTESGPRYIRLSSERQYHSAPVTFLSIAHLAGALPSPT